MMERRREQKEHGTREFPFQIYSAPDAKDSDLVPYHWHPEVEIITVLQGEVSVTIRDECHTGRRGDVFVVNAGELHEIRGGVGNLFRAFVFPLEFLQFRREDSAQEQWLQPLESQEAHFAAVVSGSSPAGQDIFAELLRIMEADDHRPPGYQLLIKASLLRIVALLAGAELIGSTHESSARPEYQSQMLRDIIEYLNETCTESVRLPEVAARFGLTPQYFCTFFKEHFGRTLIQHINLLRIQRASRYLRETDLPVMEVGFLVGFENFSYFIKRFREVFACTPTEYRKKSREQ